jgi:predicted transcriptional regulator
MTLASKLHAAFRANLSAIMERRGLSQSDLARMLDVKPAYVNQLIKGTRGAGLDTVDKVAETLGVSSVSLLRTPGVAKAS